MNSFTKLRSDEDQNSTATEEVAARTPVLGWADRLLESTTIPLAIVGLLISAIFFGLNLLVANIVHGWNGAFDADGRLFVENVFGRMALAVSLMLGYVVASMKWVEQGALSDLSRLRPALNLDEPGMNSLADSVRLLPMWPTRLVGLIAAGVGVAMIPLTSGGLGALAPRGLVGNTTWALVTNGLVFWFAGRATFGTVRDWILFSQIEKRLPPVDLTDTGPLAAFGRRGIRVSLFWIGLVSIAAVLFTNESFILPVMVPTVLGIGLAVVSLVLSIRPLQRRIRDSKRMELTRIRAAIREDSSNVLSTNRELMIQAGTRLPALLGYERWLNSISEWPVDEATSRGLVVIVLVPITTWFGEALAKRFVAWLIG